ncbi:hypothetical protein [Streptomyces sp. R35]|uniref:Uncharacterized protein n=1 Tax=Streptomyces sp. R35 TaxID=3238630 RepID=A0AB39S4T5_9ACTN
MLAGAAPILVHNCGGAEDATEIVSKKAGDRHFGSQEEARSAALSAHGVSDESLVETRSIYGKNQKNLRGPDGEPWEQLDAINDNGEMVTIDFFYGERIW